MMAYNRGTRERAVKLAREIGSKEAARILAKGPNPAPTESAIRSWIKKEDVFGDVMYPADVYHRRRKMQRAETNVAVNG